VQLPLAGKPIDLSRGYRQHATKESENRIFHVRPY
jgi:hypothetical protein